MKKVFIFLATLLLIGSCQSPRNLGAICERKAERAVALGKWKKAKKYFIKSARLLPEKAAAYYTQAALMAFKQKKFKEAMRLVEKVPCDIDNCSKLDLVYLIAWKGTVALQLGQRKKAISWNDAGLIIMDRYHIEHDSLRSVFLNNRAVAEIYSQGINGDGNEPVHFKYIHKRDFRRAKNMLDRACQLDANNCVAAYNKEVIESILEVPAGEWIYGYLPDSVYPNIVAPPFNCPVEKKQNTEPEYSFSALSKELSKKKELLIIVDISGSMSSWVAPPGDNEQPISRINMAKQAIEELLSSLDDNISVGILTVDGSCGIPPILDIPLGTLSSEELKARVKGLSLNGGTPLDERILKGVDMFSSKENEKAILLFSDGLGTCNPEYRSDICSLSEPLKEKGIQFYAFALLLERQSTSKEYGILNCIVDSTDGLLLGVDKDQEVKDKTVVLDRSPVSIPMFLDEIKSGEPKPYLGLDSLIANQNTNTKKLYRN